MHKCYLFLLIYLLAPLHTVAQNIRNYINNQKTVPYQKLYLHTDREFYFKKDTIWFAAYLVNGQSHAKTNESCNLHVDLINTDGNVVQNDVFIIQNGLASGYISLSDSSTIEGVYLLRAYTDYIKNFGEDAFFSKAIHISSIKNSLDMQTSKTNNPDSSKSEIKDKNSISNQKIDVSFLPEGGFLLANESNCVSFKAIDQTGKGIDIKGKLFDETGDLVLTFKSLYKGAGKFYFYPKPGKVYHAKLDGVNMEFGLPEIIESGAKIKLINQGNGIIQMVVQAVEIDQKLPYFLTCTHHGQVLFFMEINKSKLNSILRIKTDQLQGGINKFVLLDRNLNPVSERLVFQEDIEINNLQVRLSNESFSTREKVQLNLESENSFEFETAHVSVAVIDENYVNATGISQNIASYLLLDSELKGYIESPADYLVSDENLSAQIKLDLLMTTNGWSNYIWNSIKQDSVKMKFEPQYGLTFKGNVKRAVGKKALNEGNVSLIVKSDSTTKLMDQAIDENGNFEFRNIVFYDSASVFAQARNKRNNHNVQFRLQLPEIIPPVIDKTSLYLLNAYSEIPLSLYRQRYLEEMRLKEFIPDKNNILIGKVDVKAKRNPKLSEVLKDFFGPGNKTTIVNEDDYIKYSNLSLKEYLLTQGISVRSAGTLGLDSPIDFKKPKILLDGTPTDLFKFDEPGFTVGHNLNMIKRIEVFDGPSASIFGANGVWGVINIISKRGEELMNTEAKLLGGIVERISGFTHSREFYSPRYTPNNINNETPDYRNTLFWDTGITVKNRLDTLSFFTCDNITRYKIFVEGITETGKICLGNGEFEVNSYKK